MGLLTLISFSLLFVLAFSSHPPGDTHLDLHHGKYATHTQSAIANARSIFNTLHSAKRQWGSSVQHNGMSFIPAIVPKGALFYHGDWRKEHVKGMEWLAFDIQHAEMFAAPRPPRSPRKPPNNDKERPFEESPLENHREIVRNRVLFGDPRDDFPDPRTWVPGYLHVYRAARRLKLLYFDGMAAANCDRGTYDTQTYILMENKTTFHEEFKNAAELCKMGAEWGIDGFVRMELGFEIIYCEFQDGLDLLSSYQTPHKGDPEDLGAESTFETIRETSQGYRGINTPRLNLMYSNMVSAYFYPTNLTNPIPGNEDPRLLYADPVQLARIKWDLTMAITAKTTKQVTEWQVMVVDMITARYSDRLLFLATGPNHEQFLKVVNNLLNTYVDYNTTTTTEQNIERCACHYLLPVTQRTNSDQLLYAAVRTVMKRICSTLFQARDMLIAELESSLEAKPSTTPQKLIQELNAWLDWPDWKFCDQCKDDELCYIAMFPFGTEEDHFFPGCRNATHINSPSRNDGSGGTKNYWWSGWKPYEGLNPFKPEPKQPKEDL